MRNVVPFLAANNILLMRKFSFLRCLSRKSGRSLCWPFRNYRRRYLLKNKLNDRMIKQLLNSVITKYRDLSLSR